MVRSIGLDIVEVERIATDLNKFGQRFIDRILGPDEKEILAGRVDRGIFLAGRFAAKEAIIKALAPFFKDRPPYSVLQILPGKTGAPELSLPDDMADQLGDLVCQVSITHERRYAAAVAIFC